jgi:hypothetical protein
LSAFFDGVLLVLFQKTALRRRVNRRREPLPVARFKQGGSRAPQHRRAKSDADPISSGRNRLRAMQQ